MSNIEEYLKKKMAEGWNINIECKSKGRVYEMTYEGYARKVITEQETKWPFCEKHAVGNTIEELLINLFGKEE